MAVYTILANSSKNNRSTVVIEFEVPVGDNTAGVSWQDIVAELRDESGSVNPRKVADTAHITALDAGSVMELQLTVDYDAGLTNTEKVAVLDAAVAEKVTGFTTEFANLYQFYGTERNNEWRLLGDQIRR